MFHQPCVFLRRDVFASNFGDKIEYCLTHHRLSNLNYLLSYRRAAKKLTEYWAGFGIIHNKIPIVIHFDNCCSLSISSNSKIFLVHIAITKIKQATIMKWFWFFARSFRPSISTKTYNILAHKFKYTSVVIIRQIYTNRWLKIFHNL